jgi:hypothetical protein
VKVVVAVDSSTQLDVLVAFGVSIAGLSALIVQIFKQIFIDPKLPQNAQRDWALRGITYVLNFALLCLVLWSKGLFDVSMIYEYLLISVGQSVGSHVAFKVLSSGSPGSTQEGGAGDTSGLN